MLEPGPLCEDCVCTQKKGLEEILIDSRQLGQLEVLSPEGEKLRLGSLWEEQPIVLVLIRHFG